MTKDIIKETVMNGDWKEVGELVEDLKQALAKELDEAVDEVEKCIGNQYDEGWRDAMINAKKRFGLEDKKE